MTAFGSVRNNEGFTLVELMVTVAVVAILLAVGIPSFGRLIAQNRISSQTNEFIAGLSLARSEAITRGQKVAIRANQNSIDFAANGWTVFLDADGDGAPGTTASDGPVLRETGASLGRISVKRVTQSGSSAPFTYTDSTQSDKRYVVFSARGAGDSGARAFFKICDAGNTSTAGRVVLVSAIGKISVVSTSEACT